MGEKSHDQLKHAALRAFERHGLDLTMRDVERLSEKFRSHQLNKQFILKQSLTRSWWRIRIDYRWVPIVWDKTTKQIATFLSEDMILQWRPKMGEWSDE